MVGIVRTSGRDDGIGANRLGIFRRNFRRRVRQRENQGVFGHSLDHVRLENSAGRQSKEDVGAIEDVRERARGRWSGIARLDRIHPFGSAFVHDAFSVGDQDVFHQQSQADELIETGDRCSTGTRACQLDVANVLADDLEPVKDRRGGNDRSAVLIIVEDRDLHALTQRPLDIEAFRSLDVLEVDPAEGRLKAGDDVHELVWIAFIDLDVEYIDAGEFLEQAALAFHHRLAGEGADIAQPKHGGAIGDHCD